MEGLAMGGLMQQASGAGCYHTAAGWSCRVAGWGGRVVVSLTDVKYTEVTAPYRLFVRCSPKHRDLLSYIHGTIEHDLCGLLEHW